MIKAILFILLAQNSNGEVLYANGIPLADCKAETVQAKLAELPQVPAGMRLEYECIEPGPKDIETKNN